MGTARSLSRKRLLLPETSQRRWRAMFEHPDREDLTDGRYRLRVDVRPDFDSRHIDMVNSMNTDWNMRTLVLMAASGAITLEDIDQQLIERTAATRDEDRSSALEPKVRYAARPLVTVTVDDSMHMSAEFWEDHIPAFRKAQDAGAAASLRRLRDFLSRDSCSADAIGPLYEIPSDGEAGIPAVSVAPACGGCPRCRHDGRQPFESIAAVPAYPWSTGVLSGPTQELIGEDGHLVVCLPDEPSDVLDRQREVDALRRLTQQGFRNIIALAGSRYDPAELHGNVAPALFVDRELMPSDLPPGPTLVMAGPSSHLSGASFARRDVREPRVWLIPRSVAHPERPDQSLCERTRSRVLHLDEFVARLLR